MRTAIPEGMILKGSKKFMIQVWSVKSVLIKNNSEHSQI